MKKLLSLFLIAIIALTPVAAKAECRLSPISFHQLNYNKYVGKYLINCTNPGGYRIVFKNPMGPNVLRVAVESDGPVKDQIVTIYATHWEAHIPFILQAKK